MFSWLSHVPLILSRAGHGSSSCERTRVPDDNKSHDGLQLYGVREVSESQNKQGVKISTLEIKNWGLQQQPQLAGGKGAAPSALPRISVFCTQPSHKGKSHLICSTSFLGHQMIISCLLSSLQVFTLKASLSRDQKNTQPTSCELLPLDEKCKQHQERTWALDETAEFWKQYHSIVRWTYCPRLCIKTSNELYHSSYRSTWMKFFNWF